MPAYECRQCRGMMDPREVVSCPHCSEKKPFSCSKCSAPINHHDIYGIEKLTTKKPLLCLSCGHENEVLKCALCNISLMRSQGVTVSNLPNAKIYHKKCLGDREKTIAQVHRWVPAMILVGVSGAAAMSLMNGSDAISLVPIFILGGITFVVYRIVVSALTPK